MSYAIKGVPLKDCTLKELTQEYNGTWYHVIWTEARDKAIAAEIKLREATIHKQKPATEVVWTGNHYPEQADLSSGFVPQYHGYKATKIAELEKMIKGNKVIINNLNRMVELRDDVITALNADNKATITARDKRIKYLEATVDITKGTMNRLMAENAIIVEYKASIEQYKAAITAHQETIDRAKKAIDILTADAIDRNVKIFALQQQIKLAREALK